MVKLRIGHKADYKPHRMQMTAGSVPADVRSVLDVGCGRGDMADELDRYRVSVFGLDLDFQALEEAQCLRIHGDARDLPVRDRSVDLVMLTECLEHLDDRDLMSAVREAERVAGKYLLVSVPFRQNLAHGLVRCRCGHTFHAYGHVQRFDEGRLRDLFGDFELRHLSYAGERRLSWSVVPRLRHLGGRYAAVEDVRCNVCGNGDFPYTPRNLWTVLAGLIEKALAAIPLSVPIWMVGLYERVQVRGRRDFPRGLPARVAD